MSTPLTAELAELVSDLRRHLLWQQAEGPRSLLVPAGLAGKGAARARSSSEDAVAGRRGATAEKQGTAAERASVASVGFASAARGLASGGLGSPSMSAGSPGTSAPPAMGAPGAGSRPTSGVPSAMGASTAGSTLKSGAPPATGPTLQAPAAWYSVVGSSDPALPKTVDEVRRELGECTRCKLCQGRTQIVFGSGNPRARLVFVGEAPGAEEDAQGVPFVGKAGQLLTKMIEAMGFSRDEVYICNVVKCRPPDNRNPEPDEIAACEPFLKAQLQAIRPEVIVALGKFAAQTLLRDPTPITRMRGQWRRYEGAPLMPTFHPAYLLRQPNEKKVAWSDLQQVMQALGKSAPPRGGG